MQPPINQKCFDLDQIIYEYDSLLSPMAVIAKKRKVTRQAIYKILKKSGVDTSKRKLIVTCHVCGDQIARHKVRVREQKRHFCTRVCYIAWMESLRDNYKPSRQGQRLSRQTVAKVFDLQPDHVVHHEDKDCWNYAIHNLKVFACNGDHVRYHRGFDVKPIWDGSQL